MLDEPFARLSISLSIKLPATSAIPFVPFSPPITATKASPTPLSNPINFDTRDCTSNPSMKFLTFVVTPDKLSVNHS